MFYLVQRMASRAGKPSPEKGFDGFFKLDYMGSSEFEWGAIPRALEEMRRSECVVEPADVSVSGKKRRIFFVGAPGVSGIVDKFARWAAGDERLPAFYGKEWTNLPEVLSGSKAAWIDTDAWWSIEDGVAWAFDEAVADRLAKAFNWRPTV